MRQSQNCVKKDPCDVIKMREMRGEEGKNPLNDVTWLIFDTILTQFGLCLETQ